MMNDGPRVEHEEPEEFEVYDEEELKDYSYGYDYDYDYSGSFGDDYDYDYSWYDGGYG